jgi:hypothetical protein
MSPRPIRALALLAVLATAATAEFSPLSVHPEGFGMPLAQMGSRERAMGEGGMAAVNNKGFFLPNLSRSAFHDKTVFIASLENDVDWLRDDASSARMSTGAFPTLATLIHSKKLGTFGAYYQQRFMRNFEVNVPRDGNEPAAGHVFEGGVYVLGVSWAYAPLSWLALGVSQNLALGRDRFIHNVDFTGTGPDESENMADTSLETSSQGTYPALSLTVRLPKNLDVGLSYTHSAELEVSRTRHTNNQGSNPLPDTTMALPKVFAAGVAWNMNRRQTAILDVFYEDWTEGGARNPALQISAGYEFRGSDNPFDGLFKRTAWRAGAGYKTLYLQEVPELFATAGFGMPLGFRGHQLDFALKYGHRSFDGNTFFAEDYVKLSASVVGVSVWGQPVRKRR